MNNSVVCVGLLTSSLCLFEQSASGEDSTAPESFAHLYFNALLTAAARVEEALPEITRAGVGGRRASHKRRFLSTSASVHGNVFA